jgi:F-type H+-transporting ATPase subunit delta
MSEPAKIEQEIWDVSAHRIARVYAESLLNVAQKQGKMEAVLDELNSLVRDVFDQDPRTEILFSSAAIGRKNRAVALEKYFKTRASETFFKFLLVLNDHERLDLIRAILTEARDVYEERTHRLRVLVYTAVPLAADQKQRIENRVRDRFHLEPILVSIQDPALLGGLKIRIGDRQFDGTVRARLEQFRQQLIARSSHEIQSGRDRFSTSS